MVESRHGTIGGFQQALGRMDAGLNPMRGTREYAARVAGRSADARDRSWELRLMVDAANARTDDYHPEVSIDYLDEVTFRKLPVSMQKTLTAQANDRARIFNPRSTENERAAQTIRTQGFDLKELDGVLTAVGKFSAIDSAAIVILTEQANERIRKMNAAITDRDEAILKGTEARAGARAYHRWYLDALQAEAKTDGSDDDLLEAIEAKRARLDEDEKKDSE